MIDAILFFAEDKISTRKDIELWQKRIKSRNRTLLISYALGVVLFVAIFFLGSISSGTSLNSVNAWLNHVFSFAIVHLCCGGPVVLFPVWLLYACGVSEYKQVIRRLESSNRVCAVCGSVALFGGQWVNPPKGKSHTADALVPEMYVVDEDGRTHVLCDACFLQVNAMEQA